jgi:hypothetical protein
MPTHRPQRFRSRDIKEFKSRRLCELDLSRGQHLGNTISTLFWGIHYGDLRDSLPFRILICAFGLVVAMLAVTGIVIWWKNGPCQERRRRVTEPWFTLHR